MRAPAILPCASLLVLAAQAQQPTDICHVNCRMDRQVQGCLDAGLCWTATGASFSEPGRVSSWGCTSGLRVRSVHDGHGTVWEYMTHCRPWPVRSNVLDTLRITRTGNGTFAVERIRPQSDSLPHVTGTDRTTRPLRVLDVLTVDVGRRLSGKPARGCMRKLRDHPITMHHLTTDDDGPLHTYVWSAETGLLYMIVPNAPRPADEMQSPYPGPGVPGLKEIKPGCPHKAALFAWLTGTARQRWP